MKYKIEIDETLNREIIIRHNDNGTMSTIPTDPANSDYQRYLRWLENPDAEEGGTL